MKSFLKIGTGPVVIFSILVFSLLTAVYFFSFGSKKEKFAFYREPMVENENDVWRLPIIEPYELITAYCCTGWNFQKRNFPDNFSADSINLENGYILFYSYSNKYGFLDVKRRRVARLDNYQQFTDSLNARGIKRKLYSSEIVYRNWRETGQFPWAEEILSTQKGDSNN